MLYSGVTEHITVFPAQLRVTIFCCDLRKRLQRKRKKNFYNFVYKSRIYEKANTLTTAPQWICGIGNKSKQNSTFSQRNSVSQHGGVLASCSPVLHLDLRALWIRATQDPEMESQVIGHLLILLIEWTAVCGSVWRRVAKHRSQKCRMLICPRWPCQ